MQFLRTFSLLLLLVLGNAGNALTYGFTLPDPEKDQTEFQFIKDLQNLSESILITPAEVQINRTIVPAPLVPEHYCPRRISQDKRHILFSRTIIPSLDIAAIIFPFHTFL